MLSNLKLLIQILYRGGSDGVDYDEMAWELEKCVTYHYIATKPQIIVNEEATMARKGLDPVSRKTKTPGRKKSGFCVYLAYQLIDSVTHDQARSNPYLKSTNDTSQNIGRCFYPNNMGTYRKLIES